MHLNISEHFIEKLKKDILKLLNGRKIGKIFYKIMLKLDLFTYFIHQFIHQSNSTEIMHLEFSILAL